MSNNFQNYLLSKGLSNSTVEAYNRGALEFISWLDRDNTEPENATAKEVAAYMNYLKKKEHGNSTRSMRLNIIKQFFDYQVSIEVRQNNPVKYMKIRGAKHKTLYPLLSKQELDNIYYAYEVPAENDERNNRNWFENYMLSRQRNKVILGLMVWQGLQTPEVNNITIPDVKLREGKIYIAGSKKGAERTLDLKPQQIIELMEYLQKNRVELLKKFPGQEISKPQSEQRLFLTVPSAGQKESKRQDSFNTWKRLSDDIRKKCPRFINFLQVRASVITHWIAQYNLRQVQYFAGHKQISTTEGYLVNQVEDLQNDIEKYHPIG